MASADRVATWPGSTSNGSARHSTHRSRWVIHRPSQKVWQRTASRTGWTMTSAATSAIRLPARQSGSRATSPAGDTSAPSWNTPGSRPGR